MAQRTASLKWRTLLLAVLILAGIHTAYGVGIVAQNRSVLEQAARSHLERLAEITAFALSAPLWDFDMVQVENALSALGADPDIVAVWLTGPDGVRIAQFGQGDNLPEAPVLTARYPVIAMQRGKEQVLGSLTVQMTAGGIEKAIAEHTRRIFVLSGAVLLVAFLGLLAVARTVTAPLQRIREAIVDLSQGRLRRPVPAVRRSDEIGEVARAVEGFRCTLVEVEALRAENDRLAGEERLRIRAALESIREAAMILDERGMVLFANPAARVLLPDVGTGRRVDLSGRLPRPMQAGFARSLRRREPDQAEIEITTPDGRERLLNVSLTPILGAEGRFFGTVILASDISQRVWAERELAHRENHDGLTDLPNRRLFKREIARRFGPRGERETAVLVLDLDRFSVINDTMGHGIGDRLLIRAGQILDGLVPGRGHAARLGGDEFALLLSGDDIADETKALADELAQRLRQPITIGDHHVATGATIGYVVACRDEVSSGEALRMANLALQAAKLGGRGRAVMFEAEMTQALERRGLIEAELRRAIAEETIYLRFQKQLCLPGRLVGFEALARWDHPQLGSVPPAEFVAVAEQSGLIVDLTKLTLRQGCSAAAEWYDRGFRGRTAVNLSPELFREDVVAIVEDAMRRTKCPPEALELEITESVLLSGTEANRAAIETLRQRGIDVALDDFGMGFSSLAFIARFPVDRIKIDRAFVADVSRTDRAAAVVSAITELGHALGMQVTAEGVEDEEQLSAVVAAGVDCIQGFLHGCPMSREEAREVLLDDQLEQAGARPGRAPLSRPSRSTGGV